MVCVAPSPHLTKPSCTVKSPLLQTFLKCLPPPHSAGERADQYQGSFTISVFLIALIAASGGLIFGYDIGITGGVVSMTDFQQKFFPLTGSDGNAYCK